MKMFTTTADSFNKEVDGAMSIFKSTIDKLKKTSEKAIISKTEKQEEITMLEIECANLETVSAKAYSLADKLAALFE